ncbi:MAG: FtsQ-type POTRA domain-containing protein [Alphaproteobacteria bacterium]|nr:FtsQ-type POTRA domain-containing protein [Alphaproteobacteria bacterium]
MPPLKRGKAAPDRRTADKTAGKTGRRTKAPLTDRQAQAASFIRRRQVQAMRRIGTAVVVVTVVGGGVGLWAAGLYPVIGTRMANMVPSLSDISGLTVSRLEISGTKNLDPEEVVLASGVEKGQKIGDIDLGVVREQVESIGWVRTARVSRILPGTIQIAVTERVPYAFWQENRELRLIDRNGVEITQKDLAHFAKLPLVVGQGAPAHARSLFELMESEPALAPRVQAAVRVGDRRWDLRLANGVNVRLPEAGADTAWHKLAALERHEGILERDILNVDLRLPDRITVRLTPDAADARREAAAAAAKAAKAAKAKELNDEG